MTEVLPAVNHEVSGITDVPTLLGDIDRLRAQLGAATEQITHEQRLAIGVHRARGMAMAESPALRLVFGVKEDQPPVPEAGEVDVSMILSSAFMRAVGPRTLPEGFSQTVTRHLRKTTHPDVVGEAEVSKEVGGALDGSLIDPALGLAKAMLEVPVPPVAGRRELLVERHRLHLAVSNIRPSFIDEAEASEIAEKEVAGAEWRVRAIAAHMTVELLTGGEAVWHQFLAHIASAGKVQLINMVNRVQPELGAIAERIVKGEPLPPEALDIAAIDPVLERIWSTIKKDGMRYAPPYQNWLEILMPAMRALDPGKVPGQEYTTFEPPIRVSRAYYEEPRMYDLPYNRSREESQTYDPWDRYGRFYEDEY